ncbi:MAG: hypothetical protein COS92_07570 [Desulfobacterales bacterium CG07_land_8_20_14_0_80_52_14]|nr:MAG: hypothetical protein COX20_05900 [Desulfobacterales bacterium CG23_combo_of_CG06-09_8_20_14_all_52_9]PIU49283.1 MAG: hypothetical protein COS92_07570 [Desulfobacterales bacterium CG07_land_8_20_14_0_80_52_14]
MMNKQKILIAVASIGLLSFLFFILFGGRGFTDYLSLKAQKQKVLDENEVLVQKNISLYHRIERLKHDPKFAEYVIRKDLGVVRKDEIIFKKTPHFKEKKSG